MGRPKKEQERIEDLVWKDLLYYIILGMLSKEPMHGYEIRKRLMKMSGVELSASTVYAVIYNLVRWKHIEGTWRGRRKVYKITDKGEKVLDLARKIAKDVIIGE